MWFVFFHLVWNQNCEAKLKQKNQVIEKLLINEERGTSE